jgi:hypothetical protein
MERAIVMVLTDFCFGYRLKVRQNLTLVKEKERRSDTALRGILTCKELWK